MKDQSKTNQALIQELASLRQRIVELEQSESVCKQVEEALKDREAELTSIYENTPLIMLLVDKEWTIRKANVFTAQFVGRALGDVINLRCGESLHCIHSLDAPEGCGFGPSCEECTLRLTAINTIETGHGHREVEARMSLSGGDKKREAIFLLSTARLTMKRQPMALVSMKDITESKQTENALRRSEKNFRYSFDDSLIGIRIVTAEGETIYANQAILDVYGYDSIEELKTTPVEKRYIPESYAEFKIRREKRKRCDDAPSEYEISIIRKGGEVRHLQVLRKGILWNDERQFQVLYSDITDRKQAENALRESEEKYRSLFENSVMGISQAFPDGRIITANTAYAQMYGYANAEEIMVEASHVGQRYANPEDREEVLRILKEKGVMEPREIVVVHRNGTRFTVLVGAREIRDSKGNLRYYQAEHIDITDRKRLEETLQETEKQYKQLAEDMPALICTFLPDSTLTYVNSTYCELFQKRSNELVGQQFLYFIQDEATRENVRRQYMSLTPENPVKTYEHDVIISDGTGQHYWHRWTDRAFFNDNGEIDHFQSIGQDITSRKRAEEELTTSHKQLRALAGRLQQIREEERLMVAREIHDEMGGGLTGLKMDLSWLLRKMGDADPWEERVVLMDKIHTSNALIDQMIKIVRRISTDLRPSVLDDLGLIAALEWQLSEFTSRTEISHEFVTSLDYVNLENESATGVFRVFQEVLTNVMRHSQATKVTVVLRESERSLFGDESLVLEIRDNGRGITEEEILKLESLGLLGMKERVLAFGGKLSIRGEPGGGTSLVLKIPRIKGEPS